MGSTVTKLHEPEVTGASFLQKTFELPNSKSGTCNQKNFIAKGSNSRRTACEKGTCEAVVGQSSGHGQAGDARSCRCNGGLWARGLARALCSTQRSAAGCLRAGNGRPRLPQSRPCPALRAPRPQCERFVLGKGSHTAEASPRDGVGRGTHRALGSNRPLWPRDFCLFSTLWLAGTSLMHHNAHACTRGDQRK